MSAQRGTRGNDTAARIDLRRAYDPPDPRDGYRVLVDRRWPRGVRRDELSIDEWARDVAPSEELRRWFGHDPQRWDEFRRRYLAELETPEGRAALERVARRAASGHVTLVFGARDREHNQAVVLAEAIAASSAGGEGPERSVPASSIDDELER